MIITLSSIVKEIDTKKFHACSLSIYLILSVSRSHFVLWFPGLESQNNPTSNVIHNMSSKLITRFLV